MAPAMVTGEKLSTKKKSNKKPGSPIMKPGQKRSATDAGLKKQDRSHGGKKFDRGFDKTPGKKTDSPAESAAHANNDSRSSIPRFFERVSALKAVRHSLAGKTIDVGNLPDMEEKQLSKKLLALLSRHGKIITHEFCSNFRSKLFRVVFETYDGALAAKKLNGEVLKDRHLCILHRQDSYMHLPNRILISNIDEVVANADYNFIWKAFGDCGKIYSIMMCFKKKSKCLVTFETLKGKSKALSLSAKYKKNNILVSDQPFDTKEYRKIFLGDLSRAVSEKDIEKLLVNVGQHCKVNLVTRGTASVEFKEQSDIIKAFPLDGKMLKGSKISVYVAEYTSSLFSESDLRAQEMEDEEDDSDDGGEEDEVDRGDDEEEEGDSEDGNEEDEVAEDDDDDADDDDDDEEEDEDEDEEEGEEYATDDEDST